MPIKIPPIRKPEEKILFPPGGFPSALETERARLEELKEQRVRAIQEARYTPTFRGKVPYREENVIIEELERRISESEAQILEFETWGRIERFIDDAMAEGQDWDTQIAPALLDQKVHPEIIKAKKAEQQAAGNIPTIGYEDPIVMAMGKELGWTEEIIDKMKASPELGAYWYNPNVSEEENDDLFSMWIGGLIEVQGATAPTQEEMGKLASYGTYLDELELGVEALPEGERQLRILEQTPGSEEWPLGVATEYADAYQKALDVALFNEERQVRAKTGKPTTPGDRERFSKAFQPHEGIEEAAFEMFLDKGFPDMVMDKGVPRKRSVTEKTERDEIETMMKLRDYENWVASGGDYSVKESIIDAEARLRERGGTLTDEDIYGELLTMADEFGQEAQDNPILKGLWQLGTTPGWDLVPAWAREAEEGGLGMIPLGQPIYHAGAAAIQAAQAPTERMPQGLASRYYKGWIREQFAAEESIGALEQYFPGLYESYAAQPELDFEKFVQGKGREYFEKIIPQFAKTGKQLPTVPRTVRTRYR